MLALLGRMSGFFLIFAVSVFSTGYLGVKGDGAMLLGESIEHLVNYTAYEALDQLKLESIGNDVANSAYKNYKDVLGILYAKYKLVYIAINLYLYCNFNDTVCLHNNYYKLE